MSIDRLNEREIKRLNETTPESATPVNTGDRQFQHMIAEVEDYAIFLLDENGLICSWNKGAERIKGYQAAEILGKSYRLFYTQEDIENHVPDMLLDQARKNGKANHEGWRKRKDGSLFWGSIVITALHNPTGDVIGFTKVTRDLTERKEAEDALKAKNRDLEMLNAELSSFAYVASHDLKEPIRKIQLFADLQMKADDDLETIRGYSQKIATAAARMHSMMDALLKFATMSESALTREWVDLNQILAAVESDLEIPIQSKQALIQAQKLPTVKAVAVQMHQLFLNLISNSLKFTREEIQPVIRISAQVISRKNMPVGFPARHDAYYRISFIDNGLGFSPEQSQKIFEVFRRLTTPADYPGTGIGLAIVKKVAENHEGIVVANGRVNEGAEFHVYLPVFKSPAPGTTGQQAGKQ